jgi:hypothetical protein
VEIVDGQLVIIMELADGTLTDVFQRYRQQGAAGIPRDELLGYIRDSSDARLHGREMWLTALGRQAGEFAAGG